MTSRTLLRSLVLRVALGLGIGLLVVALTHSVDLPVLREIEFWTIDYRYQQRGVLKDVAEQGNVIIVSISDQDTSALPASTPFPRSYYAHAIENLNRAGARTIVLDVNLEGPGAGDDSLRAVLQRAANVVLSVKPLPQETQRQYLIRSAERSYTNAFYDVNKRVGAVQILHDPDHVVRRYVPSIWSSGYLTPTLAFGALNHAYRLSADSVVDAADNAFFFGDREIPKLDAEAFGLNYYGPARTFRFVPFAHVIDDASFWTNDELEIEEQINVYDENLMRAFSNKVVIIGSTMADSRDVHATPMIDSSGRRMMDGVEIHATAIQNIIDRNFVRRPSRNLEVLFVLFASVVAFVAVLAVKRLNVHSAILRELLSLLVVLLLLAGIVELTVQQFNSQSLLMNVVNAALAVVAAYVGTIVHQYCSVRQEKSLIRNSFSPYIEKQILGVLISDPSLARLGGDKRMLTVFSSNISDFSTISEPLPPEKLIQFLNEYRDEMSSIILKHGGTLDTFKGDTMLAFWGAPIAHEDHAKRACLAALEMQMRLDQIRPRWQRTGKPSVDVRMGIDTAEMIVGNMGGKERFDYSVVGKGINLAHRLEGANKTYRTRIIISEFTHAHVRESIIARDLDLLLVKGYTEPVRIWELLTTIESPLSDLQQQSLDAYHEGLRLYREQKWNEAMTFMQVAKSLDPTCLVADIYEQRMSHYKLNPPPADWNGVFTMAPS